MLRPIMEDCKFESKFLENTSSTGIFAASDNYLWRHLTIDGLYVDHALNSKMETKNRYMTLPYDDYSIRCT